MDNISGLVNCKPVYLNFWSNAFELEQQQLEQDNLCFVSNGWYVNRDPDGLIYFYQDYNSGKRILASSDKNLKLLKTKTSKKELEDLNIENISKLKFFNSKELVFNDLDHFIWKSSEYSPADYSGLDIKEITTKEQLEEFYQDCSEDDIDTLDLNFDGEFAIGVFIEGKLVGVSRYCLIPHTLNLADITVLVRKSFRGQGLSVKIVSFLVDEIKNQGYCPRYRVKEDNLASRAVAKRLGFRKCHHVKVWEVSL